MANLHGTLASLVDKLDASRTADTDIILWGCPIPVFGDLFSASVASLGLNPSSREFVDESGQELEGDDRRFHTLTSLGISSWSEVDGRHLDLIVDVCSSYFEGNPYDAWFRKLDIVVSSAGASFYDTSNRACHLDLVPYATKHRWGELTARQRASLVSFAGNTLGLLLRDSGIQTLILNGSSVVRAFQAMGELRLREIEMPAWSLPRQESSVPGLAYWGKIDGLPGVQFDHEVSIVGFNHNLQSSFGISNEVVDAVAAWVRDVLQEDSG